MTLYAVAGLATKIDLPVPLIINLLPTWQTNQRPGIPLAQPPFWIQHETGNTKPGAGALMHRTYLFQGAPDNNGNPQVLSYHFTVDDHVIYQLLPVDEVSWQAADGAGPGNMQSISCELCVNVDGNKALSRRNAEALCGGVMKALKRPPSAITRHWDRNWGECCNRPCDVQCGNRHHCPDQMMSEGYWPTFVTNSAKIIVGGTPVPNPDPNAPEVYAPGVDSELCKTWFGTVYADGRSFSFDPDGPVSSVWLQHGLETGLYPRLTSVRIIQDSPTQRREYFSFEGGMVVYRATGEEARVLTKAA